MAKYKIIRKQTAKRHDKPLSEEHLSALERLAVFLERSRLNDYVSLLERPGRWFSLNFMGGIARGIGLAIGFTLLGALAFVILSKIVSWNLPVISDFLAQLLDMVEAYRGIRP